MPRNRLCSLSSDVVKASTFEAKAPKIIRGQGQDQGPTSRGQQRSRPRPSRAEAKARPQGQNFPSRKIIMPQKSTSSVSDVINDTTH